MSLPVWTKMTAMLSVWSACMCWKIAGGRSQFLRTRSRPNSGHCFHAPYGIFRPQLGHTIFVRNANMLIWVVGIAKNVKTGTPLTHIPDPIRPTSLALTLMHKAGNKWRQLTFRQVTTHTISHRDVTMWAVYCAHLVAWSPRWPADGK